MYSIVFHAAAENKEKRVPIGATGIVFVGEPRGHQLAEAIIVSVDDSTVSSGRYGHCRVWLENDKVLVADRGSDNGTWIKHGDAVVQVGDEAAPCVVHAGQEIVIGRTHLTLTRVE